MFNKIKEKDQKPATSKANRDPMAQPQDLMPKCHFNVEDYMQGPRFPMSPADVLLRFGKWFNYYEQKEISELSELWYLGTHIHRSFCESKSNGTNMEEFECRLDHLAYRYEIVEVLESGAYGPILKCLDHKTYEMVAVKTFNDLRNSEKEVKILDYLRKKDRNGSYNIVFMKAHFQFRKKNFIVYELLGTNLSQAKLEQEHIHLDLRRVAKDVAKCLQLLEKEKIFHGDIKPRNIMLNTNGQGVKVIDFGGSNFVHNKRVAVVNTQIYSAPEALMKQHYSTASDMWSLGCTLAELHTGQYLFNGHTVYYHIGIIMEVLGRPPNEFIQEEKVSCFFCNTNGSHRPIYDINNKVINPGSKHLEKVLMIDDPYFLDFIRRCLIWNPKFRLTPTEAMNHPWLKRDC